MLCVCVHCVCVTELKRVKCTGTRTHSVSTTFSPFLAFKIFVFLESVSSLPYGPYSQIRLTTHISDTIECNTVESTVRTCRQRDRERLDLTSLARVAEYSRPSQRGRAPRGRAHRSLAPLSETLLSGDAERNTHTQNRELCGPAQKTIYELT